MNESTFVNESEQVNNLTLALDCPVYNEDGNVWINMFEFWIGGVLQTCIAIPGFVGNLLFCFVLTRKELRNSFNLLLVGLACFDCCYLIGAQLETLRISFDMASRLHIMLFPYLLYPGREMAMTGSIFMIVAIAFERYIAVHNPIDYKQALNESNAMAKRLIKYLLPVFVATIIFNIPKFFEATYFDVTEENEQGVNVTTSHVNITELRTNYAYSIYCNWSQSLVLGFIPAALLVYFNTKIYLNVRERERRKRPKAKQNHAQPRDNDASVALVHASSEVTRKQDGSERIKGAPTNQSAGRRKAEDRMALTFVAIVTGFLVTNFPRIFLNFHEILVFENSMACMKAGKMGFPLWSRISVPFSQMLMVANSSLNIVFYGLFNTQFRKVARSIFMKEAQSNHNSSRRRKYQDEENSIDNLKTVEIKDTTLRIQTNGGKSNEHETPGPVVETHV